ncbi:rRNA maturation RNase YbeY [Desulfovibrio sp.]|uniref:rRNA maturation RNase YbeY n=1 Tax=Desulfovibrio sp. TaxID=885 RepID=UPI0025C44A8B|nr:rRNA maturation RNase YbeY [Desulfovibrio sp.]
MSVRVFRRYPSGCALAPLHWRQMRTALRAMLAVSAAPCGGQAPEGVELYLLDDAAVARANAGHLGCTGPTNILSFPGGSGFPGALLLSLDTLRRECLLYGQDPAEHVVRLLAHGMGHLYGLDHGPVMDDLCERHMEAAWAALCDEEVCLGA